MWGDIGDRGKTSPQRQDKCACLVRDAHPSELRKEGFDSWIRVTSGSCGATEYCDADDDGRRDLAAPDETRRQDNYARHGQSSGHSWDEAAEVASIAAERPREPHGTFGSSCADRATPCHWSRRSDRE